jgi:hypothetical protein
VTPASVFHLFVGAMGGEERTMPGQVAGAAGWEQTGPQA